MSRGITHIEELSPRDFIRVVESLSEYEATEKLDGSQILFGIDERGFYTSREGKGGNRVYNASDYELTFSNTYKRSAHLLLEAVLPYMERAGLKIGDQVEAEVLFGEVPNVVPYSKDTNYLIFLRTIEGIVDINSLNKALVNTVVGFPITAPTTYNGEFSVSVTNNTKWKIERSPIIDYDLSRLTDLTKCHIDNLKNYLQKKSGIGDTTNETLLNTPLNKIPKWTNAKEWKTLKAEVKVRKKEIEKDILGEQKYIKSEFLVSNLVNSAESVFGPKLEDGGWIEGVVLRHKKTGEIVKIVDKDTFNCRRIDAWQVRNSLTERANSLSVNYSFLGELLYDIGLMFSVPELCTLQAKKFYNPENYSQPLSKYFRERLLIVLDRKTCDLQYRLDKYKKKTSRKKVDASGIFQFSPRTAVTGSIRQKTLETFATLFELLEIYKQKVRVAKTEEDVVKAIFGKYLE